LNLLRSSQGQVNFRTRRFLSLLLESADYNYAPSKSCYVKNASNPVAACQSNLPQLAFEMLDMRSAQILQSANANKVSNAGKLGANICRERTNLTSDCIIEQLDSPSHKVSLSHL